MKLCFLAPADSIHSLRWIRFFAKRGHEILWITFTKGLTNIEEIKDKITYREFHKEALDHMNPLSKIIIGIRTIKKVRRLIADFKPDIIHTHSCGTYGLVAALSTKKRHQGKPDTPLILTPWGSDILLGSPLKKALVKWILRHADAYTVDGENTHQALIDYGMPADKISLIRFGTDVDIFTPHKKHPLSEELTHIFNSFHSEHLRILSLRSHEPIYDIACLIRACAELKKKKIGFELVLAGDGSQRKSLESLSIALGIGQHTHFIGKVTAADLPGLYGSCNVYVSTALSDSGLAASTAEAMASGLPIVVSDSSDNAEWVPTPQGGALYECGRTPELAHALEKVLNVTAAKRTHMGEVNREIIIKRNNYELEMEKMGVLYQSLSCTKEV